MYSVKLSQRRQSVDEKYLTLEQLGLLNQCGWIPSMPSFRPKSCRRDRRYANDVIGQSVSEWLHGSQKASRHKRRSRRQSASPTKKSHSANRRVSYSPIPPIRRSITTTKTKRRKPENLHEHYSSIVSTRITDEQDSSNKDSSSLVKIPQTLSLSPINAGKQCSCQITMTYRSDTPVSDVSQNPKRDEITIFQETDNGYSSIVFKGFLKAGDKFSFKSNRLINDRFQLTICINDLVDSCISSCCEFKYRYGRRIGDENSLFWIQNVDGSKPCNRCRKDANKSFSSRVSSSLSSKISDKFKLPTILTNKPTSETETQSTTSEDTVELKTSSAPKIGSHADEFHGVDTISKSTIELHADNRPSSSSSEESECSIPEPAQKLKSKQLSSESTTSSDSEIGAVPTKVSTLSVTVSEKKTEKDNEVSIPSSHGETTKDETTFIQTSIPIIQQPMSRPDTQKSITTRNIGNVENFSIAYIGENDIVPLRRIVNYIRVLNDIDALNTFLAGCIHDKIILLLPYSKARSIVPKIHEVTCIYSIYLLSTDEHHQSNWTKNYNKITGIYQTIESICDHLFKVLPEVSFTLIPILMTANNATIDIPFTYYQLLKEIMLGNDDESDLKKDMIEFCRFHYADNQDEINKIDEFEKDFTSNEIIWWYTRNCFLTKILNRALRTQEVDLLYKMRYAMQLLHTQLKSLAMNEITVVYVVLEINGLKLQENINGLLQFGAYLPAMLERPQSLSISEQTFVTFSINLKPGCAANIKHLRSSDSKVDVLVNLDTVFRIRSVEKESGRHWNVSLESINHTDQQFQQLTTSLRDETKAPVIILQLAKLLLPTNHYAECDSLAELLFSDGSLRGDTTLLASLAAVHHLLGNVDDEKDDAKSAREQFFKSLRAFELFLPVDHPLMSSSYNNIGSMYFKEDEYDQAIEFHQKALDCQLKSPSPDTDAITTYSNNIGAVYFEQGKYMEALKHLQRAAVILEKFSSTEKNLSLCVVYQKIASSYWRLEKAKEALEYYKKTLDIQLVSLPATAHQISVTYFNLSTAYARVGQIDDAVTSAQNSVDQLLKIYPPDHPEVKENQAQLEIVRQKQWLQQVLAT